MRVGISYVLHDKLGPYVEAVRAAGLDPVPISPASPRKLGDLRGLVLSGGGDVDPARYNAPPHPELKHISRKRDDLELELIREALAADLPILGICRGLQILNVACGGTLHQHIDGHRNVEHTVRAVPGSRVAIFVGEDDYVVNSRHHQAAGRIGEGLVVTATAGEVVEALEAPDHRFVVAVQWHPEDRIAVAGCRDLRIFRAFASAVGK